MASGFVLKRGIIHLLILVLHLVGMQTILIFNFDIYIYNYIYIHLYIIMHSLCIHYTFNFGVSDALFKPGKNVFVERLVESLLDLLPWHHPTQVIHG